MDINQIFKKYDLKSEAEWFEWNGGKFLIAPMGNPAQKTELLGSFTLGEAEKLQELGPAGLDAKTATEALSRLYRVYARSLVADWEDIKDGEKVFKFNSERIHLWMVEHDEFANWVLESATILRKKITKETEVVEKK